MNQDTLIDVLDEALDVMELAADAAGYPKVADAIDVVDTVVEAINK